MEKKPIIFGPILDYTHKKLEEVPREILENGHALEELYLDSNDIEYLAMVAIFIHFSFFNSLYDMDKKRLHIII